MPSAPDAGNPRAQAPEDAGAARSAEPLGADPATGGPPPGVASAEARGASADAGRFPRVPSPGVDARAGAASAEAAGMDPARSAQPPDDPVGDALALAYRALGRRDRTVSEVRSYLVNHGCEEAVAEVA